MDAKALIEKMLAQRERWVEVESGKQVRIRRPAEADVPRVRMQPPMQTVCEFVTGWEGITEADLLGAAVGASSAVEFDPALWAVVVSDRLQWAEKVATRIGEEIKAFFESKAAAAKN